MAPRRLLILGGTTEAAALARSLVGRGDVHVTTSLAGRTERPATVEGILRTGGFGGIKGLRDYLAAESIDLLIDATHPFAAQISRHAVVAAASADRPLLRLERPAWRRQPGDRWIGVESVEVAASAAPQFGSRAFLTVGAGELRPFAGIERIWFLVRLIDKPAAPLPLARYGVILDRGPFSADAERQLLSTRRLDMVIAKNSGGKATYGKIAAARELGLPVVLVQRPSWPNDLPSPDIVGTVEEAIGWIEEFLAAG